jgi:hypothetical protein
MTHSPRPKIARPWDASQARTGNGPENHDIAAEPGHRILTSVGAIIGVFLFSLLQSSLGLRGTLLLTAAVSVLGTALTFVLPELARCSLEDMPAGPPLQPPAAARGRPGIVPVRT